MTQKRPSLTVCSLKNTPSETAGSVTAHDCDIEPAGTGYSGNWGVSSKVLSFPGFD